MRIFVAVLIFSGAVIIGCMLFLKPANPCQPQKLELIATISPLADWLREVGGTDVEVHCLVSGAANPHHFEPSMKDVMCISQARAVFIIGLGLDAWAEKLARNSGRGEKLAFFSTGAWIAPRRIGEATIEVRSSAPVQAVGKNDHEDHIEDDDEHRQGDFDPHYWLDPVRAAIVVTRMGEELGKLDPEHRDAYKLRAVKYGAELKALSDELAKHAHTVPTGTKLVTFHDAYGYLFERLGIKVAAVVQVSPGVEPSPRDFTEALRIMRELGQRTVFTEPMDSAGAARIAAHELGGEVQPLDPMDGEGPAGKTYIDRLHEDVNVIMNSL